MDLHLDEGLGSIPNRFALLVERYQKLLSVHICEHALPNPKPRCIFGLSTHRLCFACAQICLLRSLRDLRRALAFKCSVVSAPPSVTDEGPLPLILLPVPAGAHVAQSLCQEQAHMRRFTDRYSASRRNPPPPPSELTQELKSVKQAQKRHYDMHEDTVGVRMIPQTHSQITSCAAPSCLAKFCQECTGPCAPPR